MDFKNNELVRKYKEGREALLIGLYQSILSILNENFKHDYDQETLKLATANVINRLTLREESRPDPRKMNNELALILKEICQYQMLKEAASFIILFDVFIGCFSEKVSKDRIEKAKKLGGPKVNNILSKFKSNRSNPEKGKTDNIRKFALSMAGTLYHISQNEENEETFIINRSEDTE